jgi:hypothetical protein
MAMPILLVIAPIDANGPEGKQLQLPPGRYSADVTARLVKPSDVVVGAMLTMPQSATSPLSR